MRMPIGFLIRRWWWRKWHPAVRIGWLAARSNVGPSGTRAIVGYGLIAVGLLLRSRRSQRIHLAQVAPGETIGIRVIPSGSPAATG